MPLVSRKVFLPIAIVSTAILVATAIVLARPEPQKAIIEIKPLLVDAAEVVKQDVSVSVSAQGTIEPKTETSIMAEIAGKIIEVSPALSAGNFFEQGDVLLKIDDRDYQVELKRAEANVASARSALALEKGQAEVAYQDWVKYGRQVKRSKPAEALALRKPQLEDAKAKLESALADLDQAKAQLDRTVIRAPYDGLIRTKSVSIGQYVTVGSPLFETFSIDIAELRLALPENKLNYLHLPSVNDPTIPPPAVTISAFTGEEQYYWKAKLVRTEGVIDDRSRVLFSVAEITDPYGLHNADPTPLRMGTFVNARISGRTFNDLVILPRHILRAGNKIWVIDEQSRLQNRQVSLLKTEGKFIYVTAGLDHGERVSLSNISGAIPGTKVRIAKLQPTDTIMPSPVEQAPLEQAPLEQELDIAPSPEKIPSKHQDSLLSASDDRDQAA